MAILRNRSQDNFTIIDNEALKDGRLSLKALGLLCKMLSLPDNWDFSEKGLKAITKKDGLTSIRSGLKELEAAGYLHREQVRSKDGKFVDWEWEVFSSPTKGNPKSGFTSSGSASSDFEPNKEIKESNTNEPINKEREKRQRFAPPTIEEVASYCKERNNSVDPQRFVNYYESNGWMVGRNKMKDWKAAVRTWENNGYSKPKAKTQAADAYLEANKDNGWGDWDWNN